MKFQSRLIGFFLLHVFVWGCASTAMAGDMFVKGVDLSVLKAALDAGVRYKMNGRATNALTIFKANGCNCVRLRLFVNPSGKDAQVNSLDYSLALARLVKHAGLHFYLDDSATRGQLDERGF